MAWRFRDRQEAGEILAIRLEGHARSGDLVLGLPRGGVVVAAEIARVLELPLDVFVVRKVGVPGHEELAMGAVASGGVRIVNRTVVEGLGIDEDTILRAEDRAKVELQRRERLYRAERAAEPVAGRTVILVDDGLATGSTMRAAIAALRRLRAGRIVAAVPVAPPDTCAAVRAEVDEMICVSTPEDFGGVGAWYEDFTQVGDAEVRALLQEDVGRRRRKAG